MADAIPLYPLYALLFADAGLSEAGIAALFVIWSAVAVVAEVPSGALADRFSRRASLVAAGLLQAVAYVIWLAAPGFAGFAAGFVLWGVGGSLASGAFQALLYDGLARAGAADRFGAVLGRAEAASLLVQLPVAGAATLLAAAGGFVLVGVASVVVCLAAAALAATLPDVRGTVEPDGAGEDSGYFATLLAGVREAASSVPVRGAIVAVAVLAGLDGLEEFSPLLAASWGVPVAAVPLTILAVPLAGAAGAALGGRFAGLRPRGLMLLLLAGAAAFAAAGAVARPAGIVGLALMYGLGRLALVVVDTRLQERITGPSRATVTSVAGLGGELAGIALFGVWALGGMALVAVMALVAAFAVPALIRQRAVPARAG